ncbi:putative trans-sialidase, Group V [Trypanosoma cruzi]|nr:putative trans-sialidase, Group V [Trypanosoma cruzi]
MLSRVAAVKAPRTHNRRGVTGSSGRRREGGESEPQRPNMSRHLFYSALLLLILVMMWCDAGGAAEGPVQPSKKEFKWKDVKNEGVTVESLGAPGLLNVGSDVFAVAEAQCKKNGVSFTGIASQLLTPQTADTPEEVLKKSKDETQVLEKEGTSKEHKKVDVSRPTTVMKGKDIYMLVGKYSKAAIRGAQGSGGGDWGLLLVKGEVSGESKKKIDWKNTESLPRRLFGTELEYLTGMFGGGGSGVKMKDGTLVFPVEATKKGEAPNDVKTVSLIIHNSKDTAAGWKLSKEAPDGGCSDPSVVEWEKDKKLMMMTACADGRRRLYESGDKGKSWTEALGTLSRVWGNKQGEEVKAVRSGFITATIDGVENNRNVMLVTLPVYPEKDSKKGTGNGKGKLHLWLTDNTHIADIGPVSDDDAAASSLLYNSGRSGDNERKEELVALYERKNNDDGKPSLGMVSVRLTAQLQRVREVLATWKKADDRVSQLCPSTAAKNPSPGNGCGADKITDGLVGFLSGSFSGNTWRDEYLGVNATVKKGTNGVAAGYADGVTFRGAWAEWPVGEQGENQLYHFANYNFTLVATVSIHNVPREGDTPIPLVGATMNDNKKTVLLGLSYDKEGKWQVLCGGKMTKELRSNWEPETTHQLVILLRNGTQGSVYVDGQRVGDASCGLNNTDSKGISHFYIGGDGGSAGSKEDVPVTATNVLLYNRPLDDNEIRVLNANKISIPKLTDLKTVAAGATDEDTARDGGANGGSTVCGDGLLPLLLLLGLWGIAAS